MGGTLKYKEYFENTMVAMLNKWHRNLCFGKTWYMNEWSANDTATCTTHATTPFPRHANCYV